MTPEGRVKDQVTKWLKARLFWHFKPVSNGMGAHGIPDFVCCAPVVITPDMVGQTLGLFVGIETKAPGKTGSVSALQKHQIEAIRAAGGVAVVADDVELVRDGLSHLQLRN